MLPLNGLIQFLYLVYKLQKSLVNLNYYYSQFHETLTTNVPNFVGKFASSLRSSQVHIGIHKPICKKVPDWSLK